jgi:GNAT superfamily N-acetyltransferase
MELRPVTSDYVIMQHARDRFPLVWSYFDASYGDLYKGDRYQWYEVLESTLDSSRHDPVVGLICADRHRDHILPNSFHLSIFEVAKELRHGGLGSLIMKHLIDLIEGIPEFRVITLQMRDPKLINFYKKFGFKQSTGYMGIKFARLYLKRHN